MAAGGLQGGGCLPPLRHPLAPLMACRRRGSWGQAVAGHQGVPRCRLPVPSHVPRVSLRLSCPDLLHRLCVFAVQMHAAGQLLMRDFVSMLPFTDDLVLLELSGEGLVQVLETGVGGLPALEGRFLQVRCGVWVWVGMCAACEASLLCVHWGRCSCAALRVSAHGMHA